MTKYELVEYIDNKYNNLISPMNKDISIENKYIKIITNEYVEYSKLEDEDYELIKRVKNINNENSIQLLRDKQKTIENERKHIITEGDGGSVVGGLVLLMIVVFVIWLLIKFILWKPFVV